MAPARSGARNMSMRVGSLPRPIMLLALLHQEQTGISATQAPVSADRSQKAARVVLVPLTGFVTLRAHSDLNGSQSAFVWHGAQTVLLPPQYVEPTPRLVHCWQPAGQVAAHEAQVPALQLGVAPRGQIPHCSVSPHPSEIEHRSRLRPRRWSEFSRRVRGCPRHHRSGARNRRHR